MTQKLTVMALAMALFIIGCSKVIDNEQGTSAAMQVTSRAPSGWTPPVPTRFEDWYEGPDQVRFCDGLGWNCWPYLDGGLHWEIPEHHLAWPLTDASDDSGPLVELQLDGDASIRMHITTAFPSYEAVLENAGGDENAARRAYDLMRARVNVPLPVVLDPAICRMLLEDYAGQKINLLPGEYRINYTDENIAEVVIPVEIY